MTAAWHPHPRHPAAVPPGDTPAAGQVPATETSLECVQRACRRLDELHGLTTLTGARAMDLTRQIRDAAHDLRDAANQAVEILTQELDRQDDERETT